VKRFRGGLVFKAHRLVYHPTLGSRVIKKKKGRDSGFQGFGVSGFQGFRVSGFQGFGVSGFRGFGVSRVSGLSSALPMPNVPYGKRHSH